MWRTDGTEDGTYLVKEIDEDGYSRPALFYPLDEERVLFSAQPGNSGFELWISDGTEAGTNAVGTAYSDGNTLVQWFTKHNDIVYFAGSVGGGGSDKKALWRTDGTADGTYRLTNASNDSSCTVNCIDLQSPGIPLGDIVIFEGHSVEYGEELYKYNPATNETSLVVDMEPGSDDSQISIKFIVGTDLFFTKYNDTTYAVKMYKTDGTAEGTSEFFSTSEGASLINVLPGSSKFNFESYLPNFEDIGLFIAPRESGGGKEVWVTDGTIDGTYQLTDINPDGNALPNDGYIAGGNLFFSAIDSEHGEELRIIRNFTDFTPSKPSYTVYTNDEMDPITFDYLESYREEAAYKGSGNTSVITPYPFTSSENHVVVNDILFFRASTDEYGDALWKTDGTADGVELVKDINPGTSSSEIYHGLTRFKDSILFSANDGTHGEELWISDGTENGTFMLKDMDEGGEDSDSDPWGFFDAGDVAYFSGSDDSDDRELWKTDGTTNGTVRVKDIVSEGSSYPSQLTLFGDEVFFVVGDQDLSSQLWKTDGTDEGTIQVSTSVSNIAELTVIGDALYFRASGSGGSELWKTDGTSAGTVLVKDINPGSDSSTPGALTVAGGTLFFRANDGTHGNELWKSDGTEDGTYMVKDISSTGTVSNRIASIGNIVYFGANDGSIGDELWRSDGTEEGTYLVKDIAPGWESSNPKQMTLIGDRLFFTADDDEAGDEFWISDGTESGTVMLANINQNQYDSNPQHYIKVGNLIVFQASPSSTNHLFSYDPTDILYQSIEGMRWSITPSLPEGLSLNSATGEITGIPTEVIDWTDYTVTVSYTHLTLPTNREV